MKSVALGQKFEFSPTAEKKAWCRCDMSCAILIVQAITSWSTHREVVVGCQTPFSRWRPVQPSPLGWAHRFSIWLNLPGADAVMEHRANVWVNLRLMLRIELKFELSLSLASLFAGCIGLGRAISPGPQRLAGTSWARLLRTKWVSTCDKLLVRNVVMYPQCARPYWYRKPKAVTEFDDCVHAAPRGWTAGWQGNWCIFTSHQF